MAYSLGASFLGVGKGRDRPAAIFLRLHEAAMPKNTSTTIEEFSFPSLIFIPHPPGFSFLELVYYLTIFFVFYFPPSNNDSQDISINMKERGNEGRSPDLF